MTRAKQELLATKEELGIYDDSLVDTDLIPLINKAWKASFARVDKNRNAHADRGWNPLNQNLLLNVDLRATVTSKERLNQHHNNIIIPQKNQKMEESSRTCTAATTKSEASSLSNNHPSFTSTVSANPSDLNFNSGQSLTCLKAMLSQEQLHEARQRIQEDRSHGKSIKEQLKANTRLSAGILFKAGSNRLGKTVFEVCKENHDEKWKMAIEKIQKEEEEYKINFSEAQKVFEKKDDVNKMTIKELTIICKPLKRKSDGAMPNKKKDLIAKYHEWVARPAPTFNYEDVELNHHDGSSKMMDVAVVEKVVNNYNDYDNGYKLVGEQKYEIEI